MSSLRPSEFNQKQRSFQEGNHDPFLKISSSEEDGVDVFFCQKILYPLDDGNVSERTEEALILNVCPDRLTIWPINVRPDKEDYLLPKYGNIERIVLARHVRAPYALPSATEDVIEILERLPEGFSKKFQFGLGLHWENRFICDCLAEIPDVSILCIHGGESTNETTINPPLFMLGLNRYHNIRKELARISARHQRSARVDKDVLAYQQLLFSADKNKFPRKHRKVQADAISDMTNIGGARPQLSKRDQKAAVRLVNENAAELAVSAPQELLSLKSDIERVTLKELLGKMEDLLSKNLSEARWQNFFLSNPFVLSLALAVPAMLIQGNPYVGGKRFDQRGGKISDFLLASASTGNLALVEIKKPGTELLNKTPYRDDLYYLSSELNGTLVQVLDQRFKLQKNLPNLKDDSGMHDIHAYSVPCIVIAGLTPQEMHEKKSLELARNVFSGVTLITFDELFGRLKEIYRVLDPNQPNQFTSEDIPFG